MKPLPAALAVLLVAVAVAEDGPPVGQVGRQFKATDTLNMRPTKNPLKSLKGRVVLFTAFQTWYEKCAEAVDDINGIHDRYGPQGLTVLAFGEQDRPVVEKFIAEKGVKFSWALIDTPTAEQFKRDWPYPGQPWSFLLDVNGKVIWQGNPRNMQNRNVFKPGTLEPLLAQTTQAPLLPKALEAPQKLLDDGLWAAAKKELDAAAAGGALDKPTLGWAKGTSEWIERRRANYLTDAETLCKEGAWWDAWFMMNDFPRRFEGMDGADPAKAKAEEIRKNPEAAKDLALGDDVAKAKEQIATKKYSSAKIILQRVAKEKSTRHAERAQELLETIPAK